MHHTFMHAHISNPKFMVMAETSTFDIFFGRNVRGRNVQAEMSVAEMSEHQGVAGQNLGRLYKCYNDGIHTCTCIKVDKYNVQNCPIASWLISPHGLCICDEQTLQIL